MAADKQRYAGGAALKCETNQRVFAACVRPVELLPPREFRQPCNNNAGCACVSCLAAPGQDHVLRASCNTATEGAWSLCVHQSYTYGARTTQSCAAACWIGLREDQ